MIKKLGIWLLPVFIVCVGCNVRAADVNLLKTAYQTVNDEYLGGVSAGEFAVWSIQGLRDMDRNVTVADDSDHVTIYYKSKLFRSLNTPEDKHDAAAWAKLSAKAVKELRKISPKIKEKDFEAYDRMLAAGAKKLDKNSKYLSDLLGDEEIKKTPVNDYAARKLDDDVLYIKIGAFNKYTAGNVRQSLVLYPEAKSIVLDLRMSPGGMLNSALEVAELFLDEGIIVSTKGRKENSAVFYRAHNKAVVKNTPIILLVDGGTASAAEVLAAAIKEQGLGVIVGTRTLGKGTVQNVVKLPGDNHLLITNAYYHTPSGKKIDGEGLKPDICLSHTNEYADINEIFQRQEPENCPREDRSDRRIDLDVAAALLHLRK